MEIIHERANNLGFGVAKCYDILRQRVYWPGVEACVIDFITKVYDLPLSVNSQIRLFADDALIYRKIESVDDVYQLQ